MKTKIKNIGKNYWQLVLDEDVDKLSTRPRVLMSIGSYHDNSHYCITDFRYATSAVEPCINFEGMNQRESINITPQLEQYKHIVLNFPVEEKNGYYSWMTNDSLVLYGADRPYEDQDPRKARHPNYIWSYKEAKRKMKEAKEFWLSFEGSWEHSKVNNPLSRPSAMSVMSQLRNLNRGVRNV